MPSRDVSAFACSSTVNGWHWVEPAEAELLAGGDRSEVVLAVTFARNTSCQFFRWDSCIRVLLCNISGDHPEVCEVCRLQERRYGLTAYGCRYVMFNRLLSPPVSLLHQIAANHTVRRSKLAYSDIDAMSAKKDTGSLHCGDSNVYHCGTPA